MLYVNVDRPLKRCVIHQQHCTHIYARKNKALNEMGPDGGWFEFATYGDASKFFLERGKPYGIERMKQCDDCH